MAQEGERGNSATRRKGVKGTERTREGEQRHQRVWHAHRKEPPHTTGRRATGSSGATSRNHKKVRVTHTGEVLDID